MSEGPSAETGTEPATASATGSVTEEATAAGEDALAWPNQVHVTEGEGPEPEWELLRPDLQSEWSLVPWRRKALVQVGLALVLGVATGRAARWAEWAPLRALFVVVAFTLLGAAALVVVMLALSELTLLRERREAARHHPGRSWRVHLTANELVCGAQKRPQEGFGLVEPQRVERAAVVGLRLEKGRAFHRIDLELRDGSMRTLLPGVRRYADAEALLEACSLRLGLTRPDSRSDADPSNA